MITNSTIYEVTYDKKVGGTRTIIVKAMSAADAVVNARRHCFTGKNFRDAVITTEKYLKPRMQGFQGSDRAN